VAFFAVVRFAVVRFAVVRFAVVRFAVVRFAVVRFAVVRFAVVRFAVALFTVVFLPVALFTVVFLPVAFFVGTVYLHSDVSLVLPGDYIPQGPSGQEARRPCRGPIRQGNHQAERLPSTDRPNGALASQSGRLPIHRAEDRGGDRLAGSALGAGTARGFGGRTTGGSVTSLLRLPRQAPARFSGS